MRQRMKTLSIILVTFTLISCGTNSQPTEHSVNSDSSKLALKINSTGVHDSTSRDVYNINQIDSKHFSNETATENVTKQISNSIPILMYHSISVNPRNTLLVEPNKFEDEIKYLHDANYHTLSFKDLEDWKVGNPIAVKPVLITFDDGYKDNYTNAYPILKKYNMKGTVFLVSSFVGDNNNHLS